MRQRAPPAGHTSICMWSPRRGGPKLRGGKSCPLPWPSAHNSQAPLEGSFGLDVGAPERWGHAVDEELGKLKRPHSLQVNEKQTPPLVREVNFLRIETCLPQDTGLPSSRKLQNDTYNHHEFVAP